MQINPFHTRPRFLMSADFWHDNDKCAAGQRVPLANRLAGLGPDSGYCPCCALLNQPLSPLCAPQKGLVVARAASRLLVAGPRSQTRP
jgi:hypothetical protein